mgnify:CR=1 FL=1
MTEQKQKKEREIVLTESLKLDFTNEAKTLKRAEVENPNSSPPRHPIIITSRPVFS